MVSFSSRLFVFVILLYLSIGCSQSQMPDLSQVSNLDLPKGFSISVYAEVNNARSMALSPDGTLFVGNRSGDKVYAVVDTNGDKSGDQVFIIDEKLNAPNGVAFKDGDLYVAEINRILRYKNIEEQLENPPDPEVIFDDYPKDQHHGWKYIAFGPDGKLYVPVGAPCNICKSNDEVYATITTLNEDGSGYEIYAEGVRNTVGFTWHPETGELWFTDNGRDHLGDDTPDCELNVASGKGKHFGYPYCHSGSIPDPDFGDQGKCSDFESPLLKMGAHVAPLGLEFNTGSMFPTEYQGNVFVALHGSWNRSEKVGYKIMRITLDGTKINSYETFVEGWLDKEAQTSWGRPVDVEFMKDGSLLVSDDQAGLIYRISYQN